MNVTDRMSQTGRSSLSALRINVCSPQPPLPLSFPWLRRPLRHAATRHMNRSSKRQAPRLHHVQLPPLPPVLPLVTDCLPSSTLGFCPCLRKCAPACALPCAICSRGPGKSSWVSAPCHARTAADTPVAAPCWADLGHIVITSAGAATSSATLVVHCLWLIPMRMVLPIVPNRHLSRLHESVCLTAFFICLLFCFLFFDRSLPAGSTAGNIFPIRCLAGSDSHCLLLGKQEKDTAAMLSDSHSPHPAYVHLRNMQ